ncbi:transcription factor bHLH111-like [Gastrolobium bilobum]|uniref:transcription factor bHLH111-like n=1 Tax=Gastrolobium bilobum TaxID=150636 RepID=UPI002AAF1DA3|nr:transcription factor bHLH111-like [Gastrolobium bilobum]
MAEETVVTSSPAPLNWWDLHASSLSPWTNTNNEWNNQPNPNSSCSCEEDISSLTIESSSRLVARPAPSSIELMREHASDNQLWSHVLSSVACDEELNRSSQGIGDNFLDALSSKSMTRSMFEPAFDYLKKLDTNWEYSGSTSFNSFEKHLNGFSDEIIENNERLNKLSNLVSTWSVAPPDPEVNGHFDPQTNNSSLSSSMDHHTQSDPCHIKQPFEDSTSCSVGETSRNSEGFPNCYDVDTKVKQENYYASEVLGSVFGRSFNIDGYQNGFNNHFVGDKGNLYNGMPNFSSCTRKFSDVISFTGQLGRPIIEIHAPVTSTKCLNLSESRKQCLQTSSPTKTNNGRGQRRASEVKKKRSEDSSDAILKKPKQDVSTDSSTKVQGPKVKLGDRITALQQIVSPFGKTDTASVLFEAIGYIKFLQEQVQLLSNPYLKTNSHKDTWGSFDRKDKGDAKLDLRSRGLCVVPISCTPQVYRENSGPDYWTPAYRGCLYK